MATLKETLCFGVKCEDCPPFRRIPCPEDTTKKVDWTTQCIEETTQQVLFAPIKIKPKNYRRKRGNGPIKKDPMYFRLGEKYGYKCWACSRSELEVFEAGEALERHHIVEKTNGGPDYIYNQRLVCTKCHYNMGHSWYNKKRVLVMKDKNIEPEEEKRWKCPNFNFEEILYPPWLQMNQWFPF